MELVDLQCNDALKIKHREETLIVFNKLLPDTPNLKKLQLNSVFSTTNLREQTFSKMKYIKLKTDQP